MIRPRDRASATGLLPRMEARLWTDGKTVTYRYHPLGGKPITLGTDKAAAIRKVLDLNGRSNDDGTFRQLWRLYQESPRWARLAESTKGFYRECWGREPGTRGPDDEGAGLAKVWAGGLAAAIKPADVSRYLTVERASAPIVANREVALLSNLFKLAVSRGLIDANPCKQVSRNPEEPRDRLVEKDELEPFIAWALAQPKPAFTVLVSMAEFAALTGNRRIEFRALHWPQVDEEIIRLTRAKGRGGKGKRELLGISEAVRVVLDRMKAQEGYNPMGAVFRSPKTGNAYTDRGFKSGWSRLMGEAIKARVVKERFTFHDLRGHYATYFKLKFGALPEMHADPATTARVYERSREVRRNSL